MRYLLSFAVFFAMIHVAYSDTLKRTVPANKASLVGAQSVTNYDCSAGQVPQLQLRIKPKHGKVTFKKHRYTLGENAGRCAGSSVVGMLVFYTPEKGFRGEDRFKVGFTMYRYDEGGERNYLADKYIISVE
ncbi:MAG: hypothetical protein ROO70_01030 [Labrenzia sp.]